MLPEAFRRELCSGHDARQSARELIAAGWIKPGTDGKPSQVVRIPGLGAVRLYVFDSRKVHDGAL
ncbi:hypothetical protein D9M69_705830 [compost metagenome]